MAKLIGRRLGRTEDIVNELSARAARIKPRRPAEIKGAAPPPDETRVKLAARGGGGGPPSHDAAAAAPPGRDPSAVIIGDGQRRAGRLIGPVTRVYPAVFTARDRSGGICYIVMTLSCRTETIMRGQRMTVMFPTT